MNNQSNTQNSSLNDVIQTIDIQVAIIVAKMTNVEQLNHKQLDNLIDNVYSEVTICCKEIKSLQSRLTAVAIQLPLSFQQVIDSLQIIIDDMQGAINTAKSEVNTAKCVLLIRLSVHLINLSVQLIWLSMR